MAILLYYDPILFHIQVYWAGPLASSCVSAFFYKFIFGVQENLELVLPPKEKSMDDLFAIPMRAHRISQYVGTRAVNYMVDEPNKNNVK